jgi:hypothetical protein
LAFPLDSVSRVSVDTQSYDRPLLPAKQRTFAVFRSVNQNKVSMEIISQIREAILNGALNPGDRLPPEKALVSNFGVSKHTLREAMRALGGPESYPAS